MNDPYPAVLLPQKILRNLIVISASAIFAVGFPAIGSAKKPATSQTIEKNAESLPAAVSPLDGVTDSHTLTDIKEIPAEKLIFDLTDCVRLTVKNNPEVKGAEYDIEDARYKLKEAQPRGIPVIDYEYEAAPAPRDAERAVDSFFEGDLTMLNRVKIGIGVPVTSFGKIGLAQNLAKEGIEAAREKRNQKSSEVVLKTKQLYYGLLFARELIDLLKDASDRIEKQVAQEEASTKSADPIALSKLKLVRFDLLKRLGEVEKKERLALQGLRIQMGLDPRLSFEIKDQHLKPVNFELQEFEFYRDEAGRYRPEARLLSIGLRAKEDEYRLEKRKLAPNIGVGGFFEMGRTTSEVSNVGNTNDFNDTFNFTRAGFGLRLKGQLNFKESFARIHQKEAQYYKMSALKDHAAAGLELDLQEAYLSAKQGKTDLQNAESAYRLARQLVFLTKTNNDVGVGDKKDYGDALQAYLLMKGRYFEAIFNYNVAVATLVSKVGYQFQP